MEDLTYEAGNAVIGTALFAVYMWLMIVNPWLYKLTKLAILALWGVVSLAPAIYCLFWLYVPEGKYFLAFLTIPCGAFMGYFWFRFGLPELARCVGIRSN